MLCHRNLGRRFGIIAMFGGNDFLPFLLHLLVYFFLMIDRSSGLNFEYRNDIKGCSFLFDVNNTVLLLFLYDFFCS